MANKGNELTQFHSIINRKKLAKEEELIKLKCKFADI